MGPEVLARVCGSLGSLSRLEQSLGVSVVSWGRRRLTSRSAYRVHPCARRPQGEKARVPAFTRVLSEEADLFLPFTGPAPCPCERQR